MQNEARKTSDINGFGQHQAANGADLPSEGEGAKSVTMEEEACCGGPHGSAYDLYNDTNFFHSTNDDHLNAQNEITNVSFCCERNERTSLC